VSLPVCRLEIGSRMHADLIAAVAEGYPREACGILLGRLDGPRRIVEAFRPAPNRWAGRDDRFLVDPESLRGALEEEGSGGAAVLGFYHSHPDAPAVPSTCDRTLAWPWYVHVIVEVAEGRSVRARAWEFHCGAGGFEERPIALT